MSKKRHLSLQHAQQQRMHVAAGARPAPHWHDARIVAQAASTSNTSPCDLTLAWQMVRRKRDKDAHLCHKLFVLVDKGPEMLIVVCSPRLVLNDAVLQELLALLLRHGVLSRLIQFLEQALWEMQ